jgi:ABC-type sugar transport system permease subunit/ABC-type glycerol-3-phosphate transport system substrate-binding protein
MQMKPVRRSLALLLALLFVALSAAQGDPVVIRMMAGPSFGIPPKEDTNPRSIARRAVFEEFARRNPGIRLLNAGGLELTGANADQGFLMAMAGDNAPDVFYVNFRQYYNFIDQGFCRPLDDLVAQDPHSLDRVNPIIMDVVRSYDGKIYSVPFYQVAMALYYRKDHFLEAGIKSPPKTWDEFYETAKKLTESKSGRSGFAIGSGPGGIKAYYWNNFLWQAGGDALVRMKDGTARANIATPEGVLALKFYQKLVTDKWKSKDGKDVGPAATASTQLGRDIAAGNVSMWFAYTNDVVLNMTDLDPALIGIARMPAGPAGPANEINAGMWAINSGIKDPAKLKACWDFIRFYSSNEAAKINTEKFVENGLGNLVNPVWLKLFGHTEELAQIDPGYVTANEQLFKDGHPEPYGRNAQQVYTVMDSALDRAVLEPNTPPIEILQDTQDEMNRKLLGYTPPELLAKQRGWAIGILLGFFVALLIGLTPLALRIVRRQEVREQERLHAGAKRSRIYRFVYLCVLPAALTILVWHYYPLAKGLIIAFQNYRILKGPEWVGLDNFISVFTQPIFWTALKNSFVYVFLSISIGFLIPIGLALALNEIPWGKVFFRTIYYLPAMTSPILIAFLWKQFYDKGETGLLNTVLHPFIVHIFNPVLNFLRIAPLNETHDWLGDPSLAMFAVVLPGIWAAAGPGSILYLAALKNIPAERYEAADLDGASWWMKIRYITLPGIKALMLINLLGVFIGGFKAMENIFVLTGGGPLYATQTLGLEIWTNAFLFLKFGYATAAAWVMGAILVGFTLVQIRSLLRMRFSTAKL